MGFYYPGMKSEAYWRQRTLDRDKKSKIEEDKLLRKINAVYRRTFINLSKELDSFYNKYAEDNKITMAAAKRILSPIEYMDYLERLDELKSLLSLTGSTEAIEELELLSSRQKTTRLQSLIDSIDMYLIETTNNVQISIEEHLNKMYQRSYKEGLSDVGIKESKVKTESTIKEAISYPLKGQMFSSRIWKNKNSLIKWIKKDMTQSIARGDSIQKMGKSLRDKEKVTKYQAERLVRTETCYYTTHGHIDAYNDSGLIYGVEFMVAGDERTCPNCSQHEGEIIKLKDVNYGSNVPPLHPNCRCCVAPIIID